MNLSYQTLDIIGYRDQPIPHTFFRQSDETDHVAIVLPGVGYSARMPLLYYPTKILLNLGADVLRVETVYAQALGYDARSPVERARWVFDDASAACRAALAQRAFRRITLVGKSLGTLAMGHLLATEAALARETGVEAIWLTPLLWNATLVQQIQNARPRSLFAIGAADPHHNAGQLAELQTATGGQAVVVEGANHSLEIKGDVLASLRVLDRVVRAVESFVTQSG